MVARIYKPSRNAMQSGTAKTKAWVLDYEPERPREAVFAARPEDFEPEERA